MSLNHHAASGLPIMQQCIAANGQLYGVMIQNQAPLFYLPTHALPQAQPLQRPIFQHNQQLVPQNQLLPSLPQPLSQPHPQIQSQPDLQLQSRPQASPSKARQIQVQHVQSKEHTNAKLKSITEKCITHYIEGQMIIETSKPLGEIKIRKGEKKKHLLKRIVKEPPAKQPKIERRTMTPPSIENPSTSDQAQVSPKAVPAPQEPQTETDKSQRDIKQIRADMPNWSVADVVKFIESHEDIKQYSTKFADDEMDGKALLLMIDRNLNLQTLASMFKRGPAMKIEAALSMYKIND